MPSRPRHHARANSLTLHLPSLTDLHNLLPPRAASKRPAQKQSPVKRAFNNKQPQPSNMADRPPPARASDQNSSHNANNAPRQARPSRLDRNPLASLASLPSFPPFGSRSQPGSAPRRANSVRHDMEALITMFGKPLNNRGAAQQRSADASPPTDPADGTVSMSQAGQKFIPATFNLVPIEQPSATDSDASSATDQPLHPTKTFDQAGGHKGSFHIDGGTLVKKVTEREARFYEDAEAGAWPTALLPKYYGRASPDSIKIENLTYGFKRPCVIDLKMGVQTVEDDEASLLKKLKMTALDHFTRSRSAGCRLEGLSMYRTLENRRIKGTKSQSHSISAHVGVSLQDVLTFFLTDESGVRTDVALRFQHAVEQILRQFEQNNRFRFIGSSILLIYDNDNSAPYMHWARALRKLHTIAPHVRLTEDQISGLTRRTRCDVRMIDFAHTGPLPESMERDEGYITGLRTILNALKAIRAYRSKPIFSMQNAVVDLMEETRANRLQGGAGSSGSGSRSPGGEFTFDSVLGELTALSETSSIAPTISSAELEDGAGESASDSAKQA